jgi:SAM-dependent methyltransferase
MGDRPWPAHRIRGPLNARILRSLEGVFDRTLGDLKRTLFTGLPGELVELGSGTGANMRYLPAGTRLTAIEPNPAMHAPLAAAATRHNIDLDLVTGPAEHLPLNDASAEVVLCTLVLCTVADPEATLDEVRRILKPGGRLLVVEHVAADPGTHPLLARSQRLVRRPWRWCFEGCDVARPTQRLLAGAGFTGVDLHHGVASPAVLPVAPMVWGTLVR